MALSRQFSFGAWKSSSAVAKENMTVSIPSAPRRMSVSGNVAPIRTRSGLTPVVASSAASAAAQTQAAQAAQAQNIGEIYGTLPPNCALTPEGNVTYYHCANMWLEPAFGANGVYYRVVAAP